eukprot:TRINITY_DN4543_c0_g1_i1.p1 TRINITY_DN4543_c0_g1~~TRINITY_DN4543_c0_g1_i1.p1  ORF type:complete len:78 (+),score=16.83 TRINITY_DN4543_c0_g1_i1:118-351(+)
MNGHCVPHVTRTTIDWGEEYWLYLKEQSRITSPKFEQIWANGLCRLCFQMGDTVRATEVTTVYFIKKEKVPTAWPLV